MAGVLAHRAERVRRGDGAALLDNVEIMFTLALDKKMERMFYPFSSFFNLLPLNKPLEIGRNASMTDSIIAATSEWIEAQRRDIKRTQ
jgi:hypothetical protein